VAIRQFHEAAKKMAAEVQRLIDLQGDGNETDSEPLCLESRKRKREGSEEVNEDWYDLDALDKEWAELEALRKEMRK